MLSARAARALATRLTKTSRLLPQLSRVMAALPAPVEAFAAARSMSAAAAAAPAAGTRTESDTMGKVEVPNSVYWGAQTQRSLENFKIGGPEARMPMEIIQGELPPSSQLCLTLPRGAGLL